MLNYSILKNAAIELNNANGTSVVKVAGIINKLYGWLKQLSDPHYRQRVTEIGTKSEDIKLYLEALAKAIENLRNAISEADVESYDKYLADVKNLSRHLSDELEQLERDAENASRTTTETSGEVNGQPGRLPGMGGEGPVKKDISVEQQVGKKQDDHPGSEEKEIKPVQTPATGVRYSIENRPGYDVPKGSVNAPYKSFEHFRKIGPASISLTEKSKDKQKLYIAGMIKKLSDKGDLPVDLVDRFTTDESLQRAFFKAVVNAIPEGILIDNYPAGPDPNYPQNEGKMFIRIMVPEFVVPELNIRASGVVRLADQWAQKIPIPRLHIMRLTNFVIKPIKTAMIKRIDLLRKYSNFKPLDLLVKKALINKLLSKTNICVSIEKCSTDIKMKYAKVLSNLLSDLTDANVSIHSEGNNVELSASIVGSNIAVKNATVSICNNLSTSFEALNSRPEVYVKIGTISKLAVMD